MATSPILSVYYICSSYHVISSLLQSSYTTVTLRSTYNIPSHQLLTTIPPKHSLIATMSLSKGTELLPLYSLLPNPPPRYHHHPLPFTTTN